MPATAKRVDSERIVARFAALPGDKAFKNTVQTLASSADDFVSYYSRALQGQFFTHRETPQEFRRILALCDFIYLVPLPLGEVKAALSKN